MKRIRNHMRACGCSSLEDYLTLLGVDSTAYDHCQELLRVTISRFFRDRALWQRLGSRVIQDLLQQNYQSLRIWSAGCACGEEPYSFAIMWDQLDPPAAFEILSTDDDPVCLRRAETGEYTASSLKELQPEVIRQYFRSQKGGGYMIAPRLRKNISWQRHNLLQALPQGPFHIIFLRNNLLTYYNQQTVTAVASKIVRKITPGGYLVIGCHERLPDFSSCLIPDEDIPYLFKKL